MAVFQQTRSGSLAEAIADKIQTSTDAIRVAIPGVIKVFNPETVTATVLPVVRAVSRENDGSMTTQPYPVLEDIPVTFPRGGGCTLTFPVREGDECLVIFADRCIDFWWQSGGPQEPVDDRMHDFSDAFCLVGPQSQAHKISGISTTSAQLRTDSGAAFIELAQGGAVTIISPQVTINGPLQVNGSITSTGDQQAGSISQMNHTHGGVQSGDSNTGKPT